MSAAVSSQILPFYVDANFGWILSKDSFICSTPNVSVPRAMSCVRCALPPPQRLLHAQISARFPGMTVCLCSGEGPFLTHVTSAEVICRFMKSAARVIYIHICVYVLLTVRVLCLCVQTGGHVLRGQLWCAPAARRARGPHLPRLQWPLLRVQGLYGH